ncbi:gp39 [Burkholderia phage BcepC6B]|uniref:Gp39 n=1 Tax=Burkholderia phage BcepC6B TaxID=2883949 RepID=Q6J1N8_9CAUD|nr:exonuclease [Burkholderia phage BcepC6B]AAT38398.1 gp39 [Burkholderia phage BcepC6B]
MNQTTIAAVVEDQEHALLSPSSAYTWIECAASTAAQIGQPDESSEYADEGTAAHELAKWCLESVLDAESFLGTVIPVGTVTRRDEETGETITEPRRTFEVDEEMAAYVQLYIDGVRERVEALRLAGAEVTLLVEQRLSIEHITGERGAKGTSDCVIIAVWPDGRAEIEVRDLKYGRGVAVSAERNPQAMIYADAAHEEHSAFYDFDRINIVIHQPRVNEKPSEWATTATELHAWISETAKPAADRALLYVDSVELAPLSPSDFNPGEKQCKFCKAKAVCPALAAHVEQTIGADFEALADDIYTQAKVGMNVDLLDNERLGVIYASLDLIDSWAKAVRGRIEHELLQARVVPGVKLVAGRRGARQWSDAEKAEALLKSMRLKQDQMYNFKLISPTQADKLLRNESPRRWKKVEAEIVQRDGRPSVAPDSDPRPALEIQPPEDDFEVAPADDGSDLA